MVAHLNTLYLVFTLPWPSPVIRPRSLTWQLRSPRTETPSYWRERASYGFSLKLLLISFYFFKVPEALRIIDQYEVVLTTE